MLCGKSHRISFRSATNANHCHVIKLRDCVRCNRWRRDGEWQHGEYTGQHASNSCISEIDTDIALKPKLLG